MDYHRQVGSEAPSTRAVRGSGEVCDMVWTVIEIAFRFGSKKSVVSDT